MNAQIVSFHCVLKNKLGHVLSSSFNRDVINQLEEGRPAEDRRLRGLVEGIQNVSPGEKRRIPVPADQAYGLYDPKLVITVPRSRLPGGEHLAIGSELMGQPDQGHVNRVYRVVGIEGSALILDGNHPLAGQDLVFEIEVVSARDAHQDDFMEHPAATPGRYLH